jgi:hypothetical protein
VAVAAPPSGNTSDATAAAISISGMHSTDTVKYRRHRRQLITHPRSPRLDEAGR